MTDIEHYYMEQKRLKQRRKLAKWMLTDEAKKPNPWRFSPPEAYLPIPTPEPATVSLNNEE